MHECDCYCILSIKRNLSSCHLINSNSQRINIASFVCVAAPCLLRRKVAHRSHRTGRNRIIPSCCSGNSKICHFYRTTIWYQNILRLNIPVNDMAVMRCLNACHHLNRNTDRLFCWKLSFLLDIILQRNSFYKLHDHIIKAAVFSDIIYIHDIRMHQSCGWLCFYCKLSYKALIITIFPAQNLYCYITV